MKTLPTTLAVALLILSATGAALFAQNGQEGAKPAAAKPAGGDAPLVFSGRSADANFQEALNDALQKAQLELTKTVADLRFTYQVDKITGTRGGFAGVNEIKVDIKVQH
jgi:hypothetical protein